MFPRLTSSPVFHWRLHPVGFNLMFAIASAPAGAGAAEPIYHCTTVWSFSFTSAVYLGAMLTFSALLQRYLNYRQRHKRQRLVQASVKPLFYQSVHLRPLKAMTTQLALDYPLTATFCLTIELNN